MIVFLILILILRRNISELNIHSSYKYSNNKPNNKMNLKWKCLNSNQISFKFNGLHDFSGSCDSLAYTIFLWLAIDVFNLIYLLITKGNPVSILSCGKLEGDGEG